MIGELSLVIMVRELQEKLRLAYLDRDGWIAAFKVAKEKTEEYRQEAWRLATEMNQLRYQNQQDRASYDRLKLHLSDARSDYDELLDDQADLLLDLYSVSRELDKAWNRQDRIQEIMMEIYQPETCDTYDDIPF